MSRCPFLRFDPLAILGGLLSLLVALALPALMFGWPGAICAAMLIGVLAWFNSLRRKA